MFHKKLKKYQQTFVYNVYEKATHKNIIGEQLGLSQYAYHKIENGKTKLHLNCLLELCKVLEIEIQDLIDN